VQIDGKWLSARADRRQAALQRQDREREEQQWFAVTANINNIPTTFTASAIAAPAIVTAVVPTTVLTAVPTISTAFTAFAFTTAVTTVAVTAVTITAIACAPTAISTAVTHAISTISTAFIAFAIAAIATAIFTAVTSSISIDFTAFAASAIVFVPSIPRTLGPRKLSARADRRLAALQRQEREREEQQWVEQLRKREPKASGNERAALRYLTREIGTVVFS
jgi:hypothetical protein